MGEESRVSFSHEPVLLDEVIESLAIKPDGVYLDGTAGGGGHSSAIAARLTTGRLIAIDRDPEAVAAAGARLAPFGRPCNGREGELLGNGARVRLSRHRRA